MFDDLSGKLESALKNIKGEGVLTELNVAKSVKEIRRALVAADVNYKIAKEFTDEVKEEALGTKNILKAVKPGELMVKIVLDKMTDLMGGQAEGIDLSGKPSIILIAGLQGSGKTTFTGKLSKFLREKKQKKVLVVACDVYRPAAIDQLTVVAEQAGVEIFKEPENKNAVQIAENAIAYAKENKFTAVIVDTAGRLA
ncbi:MAG: signal recognition particle receptor subunit alpha, partial [Saprospiraceae bacterium]